MKKFKNIITAWLCIIISIFNILGICIPVQANATDLSAFPASYRSYIQSMINQHPNWVFVPYNTNIDFEELVTYQSKNDRNLIEKSSNPEIYFSTAPGDYNSATGTYIGKSGPNWVSPKVEVIRHYLDPRNFLNSNDTFMFLKLAFNEAVHTSENVDVLLKGCWMHNKSLEDDPSMTYSQAFVKTGKETGVSSFFLASRVKQENGSGKSALISGTYPGYEGYYNYYNHGAYGTTTTEIIVNGLSSAKANGWDTRYKSLLGGASTLATKYIARKQDTLYYQKFDVVNGISYHQYMQNIQAPLTEGWTMRKGYNGVGLLEEAYVFSVPVYNNMPAYACPLPGKDPVVIVPTATVSTGDINRVKGIGNINISNIVSSGITSVVVKAYSEANGADDIYTYNAVANVDGSYTASINIANHGNYRGKYMKEVNITDGQGLEEVVGVVNITISNPLKPKLLAFQYQDSIKVKLSNIDPSACIVKVHFPTWSNENSQDDLVWYEAEQINGEWVCTIDRKSHPASDGVIAIHSYYIDDSHVQHFADATSIVLSETEPLYGDVDNNGVVNSEDALNVLKASCNLIQLDSMQNMRGNVNYDGVLNATDALIILKKAAGISDIPPIGW